MEEGSQPAALIEFLKQTGALTEEDLQTVEDAARVLSKFNWDVDALVDQVRFTGNKKSAEPQR